MRMRVCASACVLMLLMLSPLLFCLLQSGRNSVAPPFAAATLLFPLLSLADLTNKLLNVCWNTPLGATGAADAGAGVGAGAEAGPGMVAGGAEGPPPLITVHSPTKLYFR